MPIIKTTASIDISFYHDATYTTATLISRGSQTISDSQIIKGKISSLVFKPASTNDEFASKTGVKYTVSFTT